MIKKIELSLILIVFLSFLVSSSILSSPSMCCEKTIDGSWCINANEDQCNDDYISAPASCEATSYCKLGTCYDSSEGICYENTPQRVCQENGGTWDSRELGEVPQCQLGCCVIADQAAYVPLVRCKKLATYFGVNLDYRTDIESEMECIVLANSQDMGACVYEEDYERVCKFTTRGECGAAESIESVSAEDQISSTRKFYKDYLCSAEELNTVCARQATTGCYQGKVYWYDSCGNRENVFSSDRDLSWNNGKILEADLICAPNDGTDSSCGNCDYMLGSRCEAKTGLLAGEEAFCQKTECTDRWGKKRKNGESWCVNDGKSGDGKDKVGSRYFREICVDGEVRVEPCADFRNEVCYESNLKTSSGDYTVAACRINRWQDCIGITDEEDCLNEDKRDCVWLETPIGLLVGATTSSTGIDYTGTSIVEDTTTSIVTGSVVAPVTGYSIFSEEELSENETTTTNREDGVCVPRFSPGLEFWDDGASESVCESVSGRCIVKYTKKILGDWECDGNCECLDSDWALEMNRICVAQGDCGAYINYVGTFADSGYQWLSSNKSKYFKPEDEVIIKSGFSGMIIGDFGEGSEGTINKAILKEESS